MASIVRLLAAAGVFSMLVGCAPASRLPSIDPNLKAAERDKQLELAFRENVRRVDRLYSVGWRVLSANVADCGAKVKPRLGVWMLDESMVEEAYRPTWRKLYGSHGRFAINFVPAGTPGEAAGLKLGDVVLAVDGIDTGSKQSREKIVSLMDTGLERPVDLRLKRGAEEMTISLTPQRTCDYPISFMAGDAVNAYADGKKIYVTNGMLRFATSDEELALVVGHELAHNTQNHMDAKMGNQLIGGLIGAVISVALRVDVSQTAANIGQMAFSKEFESEADYVGTYYVARAGFNIEKAADFWRRMAVEHPSAIGHGTTHPDTASRFIGIEAAVKEVNEKRAAGTPLMPEKKL